MFAIKPKRLLATIAVIAGLLATAGPAAFMPDINDEVLATKSEVLMESLTVKGRAEEPVKIMPTKVEVPNLT